MDHARQRRRRFIFSNGARQKTELCRHYRLETLSVPILKKRSRARKDSVPIRLRFVTFRLVLYEVSVVVKTGGLIVWPRLISEFPDDLAGLFLQNFRRILQRKLIQPAFL